MPGKGKKRSSKRGEAGGFDRNKAIAQAAEAFKHSAKPGKWADVPILIGSFWKPKKVGDLLQGTIVGFRVTDNRFKRGEIQNLCDIRDDEGRLRTVNADGRLGDQLRIVSESFGAGCDVRITFTGTEKIKGFRNPARRFRVEARPAAGRKA